MTKYFKHLIKKNIIPLVCFTIFLMLIYVLPILTENYAYVEVANTSRYLHLDDLILALIFISILVPIYIFSYKMNKRSVDMNFSLPITRRKILIAHFLVGLIIIYASYTIAYWAGFVAIITKIKGLYKIYYLYLYLATLFPTFIIYSVTAFIYTRANTIVDGVISVIGALFLPYVVVLAVDRLCLWGYSSVIGEEQFLFIRPLMLIGEKFKWAIAGSNYDVRIKGGELFAMIMWSLFAVASTVGLIAYEKYDKAENCGQISESLFCYKLQIPVYTALLISLAVYILGDAVVICMIVFIAFVLSIIYKRTIKIGWKFAVVFASSVVIGILLSVISTAIFGSYL